MILRLLLLLAVALPVFGQDTLYYIPDSSRMKPPKYRVLPAALPIYTPETHWMGVLYCGLLAHWDSERPSTLGIQGSYSERRQFRFYVEPTIYLGKNNVYAELEATRWPDSFWGIGNRTPKEHNEEYTARTFRSALTLRRQIRPGVYAGLYYKYERVRLLKVEPDRLLDTAGVVDRNPVTTTGPGIEVRWDTRDNTFTPRRGTNSSLFAGSFARTLGSDYEYQLYTMDLRGYIPLFQNHVLAVQGYGTMVSGGSAYFRNLPYIGHENRLRGYSAGRYRDRCALMGQIEYRLPVYGRWSVVGFAGAGDVADKPAHLEPRKFKHSLGGGVRFMLLPKERVSLRIDQAYGAGSQAFYFGLNEVF